MDRITAINKSLRAFRCGVLAFIPFLGIVPAGCALANWLLVSRRFGREWNPARRYLLLGLGLSALGPVLGTVVPCLLAIAVANCPPFGPSGHG